MGCHILWCLIWGCSLCLCPIKRMPLDGMPHSVVSHMGLFSLPVSHKKDALRWDAAFCGVSYGAVLFVCVP